MDSVHFVRMLVAFFTLLMSGACPLHATERAPPENEKYERQFVLSNVEFTVRHELAHALIWELKPPVFGKEEDVADIFAVIGQLQMPVRTGEEDIVEQLGEVADGWKLEWQLALEEKSDHAYWDLHSLDIQRYYNIVCLVYGSDPVKHAGLIKTAALPIDRAEWCHEEYDQAQNAMQWARSQFADASTTTPGAVRGKITVHYEPNREVDGEKLDQWLRESGIADRIAEMVTERVYLPRDLVISFESCPFPNAVWIKEQAKIQFCHPLLSRFLYLARELQNSRSNSAGSITSRGEEERSGEGGNRQPALASP